MARPDHLERRALLAELFRRHPHYATEGADPKGLLSTDLVGDLAEILEDHLAVARQLVAREPPKPESVMLGLQVVVPGGGEVLASAEAPFPVIFERLVVARESALDACTEHEDCRASWQLGVACIAARLPPDVSLPAGFGVLSVQAGLTEHIAAGPLPASALVGVQAAWKTLVYPGQAVRVRVLNRGAVERVFVAHLECVRLPETHTDWSEIQDVLARDYGRARRLL